MSDDNNLTEEDMKFALNKLREAHMDKMNMPKGRGGFIYPLQIIQKLFPDIEIPEDEISPQGYVYLNEDGECKWPVPDEGESE